MQTNPLIHVQYSPPTLKAVKCSTYKVYNKSKIRVRGQQHYVESHASCCCLHAPTFKAKKRTGIRKKMNGNHANWLLKLFYCPDIHDIKYKILIKQLQRQLAYEQLAKANLPMYRHTTHTSRVRCSQGISVRTSAALGQNHQLHFTLTLQMRHWNTTTSVWAPLLPGA